MKVVCSEKDAIISDGACTITDPKTEKPKPETIDDEMLDQATDGSLALAHEGNDVSLVRVATGKVKFDDAVTKKYIDS